MTATDTIFALSSAAGRAAVAIIRLSGPACAAVLTRMAGGPPAPRELALRAIRHPGTGEVLDQAMAVWLPSPRSATGEDCAEFHLHGSPAVVSAVLAALSGQPGVRPAEPGEFTRRAFLNGKMDLVEVEGLADLLEARTASQRRQAYRQMSGLASKVFDSWRQQLLLVRADIEAAVDFADEPGVAREAAAGIDDRIRRLQSEISEAVGRSSSAELVRDGVRVVLAGLPNTGKSSLLNVLARRDAAIVSELPGTTRDAIEVFLDIEGVPVVLTDTAGLRREVADIVEAEGIRRSRKHITSADVLIWVWSSDVPGSEMADDTEEPDLVIRNKADLDSGLLRNSPFDDKLALSTQTGTGITEFIERLSRLLQLRFADVESSLFVSARQNAAAQNSIRHLNDALECSAEYLELKAEEIRRASDEIGRLTGKVGVEEWLGAIFSRFCIGK
jgi:tRNA modification GTPase